VAEKDIKEFYDSLNDNEKAGFFSINFDRVKSEAGWKKELEYFSKLGASANIEVSLSFVSDGKSLLENNNTTTEEWVKWGKEMQESLAK
jgi:hypothetical protein